MRADKVVSWPQRLSSSLAGQESPDWARRFSMAELVAALEGAVDVELALKGSADSETALLLWITNILRKS